MTVVCCVTVASHFTDQDNVVYEEDTDRGRMRALPEEERIKIQQQVHVFRAEKAKLDRELAKWDESGNDIIILAKQMCMIMMEMTDFTRWATRILLLMGNNSTGGFFCFFQLLLSPDGISLTLIETFLNYNINDDAKLWLVSMSCFLASEGVVRWRARWMS